MIAKHDLDFNTGLLYGIFSAGTCDDNNEINNNNDNNNSNNNNDNNNNDNNNNDDNDNNNNNNKMQNNLSDTLKKVSHLRIYSYFRGFGSR